MSIATAFEEQLRDQFAGQAIIGLIPTVGSPHVAAAMNLLAIDEGVELPDLIAGMAYRLADAMLEARKSDTTSEKGGAQ